MITLSGTMGGVRREQFRAAVAIYPKAIVAFQSPGAVWARESTSALKFGCGTT
jgi:hypothetical protein